MWRIHAQKALALAVLLSCAGCSQPTPTRSGDQENHGGAAPNVVEAARIPAPQPKLERRDLVLAVLNSATAAALGRDEGEAQEAFRGRRFEARLRFGCGGPATSPDADGWTYDSKEHVLRVRASADVSADAIKASDLLKQSQEGAIGFTMRRPLILDAGCPKAEFAPGVDGPTIAIVQFFTAADSRVQRPAKSYEVTLAAGPAEIPTDGLDLVLEGRLEPLSDQRAIHCAAKKGPFACIVSAKIDRVAIENPIRKSLIGEWST